MTCLWKHKALEVEESAFSRGLRVVSACYKATHIVSLLSTRRWNVEFCSTGKSNRIQSIYLANIPQTKLEYYWSAIVCIAPMVRMLPAVPRNNLPLFPIGPFSWSTSSSLNIATLVCFTSLVSLIVLMRTGSLPVTKGQE